MYTLDKDAVIHVRVKNVDKSYLFKKAGELGISVSDVVRYIISEYRRKDYGNLKTCQYD